MFNCITTIQQWCRCTTSALAYVCRHCAVDKGVWMHVGCLCAELREPVVLFFMLLHGCGRAGRPVRGCKHCTCGLNVGTRWCITLVHEWFSAVHTARLAHLLSARPCWQPLHAASVGCPATSSLYCHLYCSLYCYMHCPMYCLLYCPLHCAAASCSR